MTSDNPTKNRRFPIQGGPSVPWWAMEPHGKQAERNHGQTLERLAERGGLGPAEAWWVIQDQRGDWSNQAIIDAASGHFKAWAARINERDVLVVTAALWARALDDIHTKTFIGPGPHPELEEFQALEKRLRDIALEGSRDNK